MEPDVEVVKVTKAEGIDYVKGFVDVRVGPFVLRNFRVVVKKGESQASVTEPLFYRRSDGGRKLHEKVVVIKDRALRRRIFRAVMAAWHAMSEGA